MPVVTSGKNWKGEDCEFHLDQNLFDNLTSVKNVVDKKDFDYVCIVAGLPGLGKSNFAINCCKFLDPNFTIDNIAMDDKEFIEKTSNASRGTAIMLDESFASLNSKISMTSSFLRIINHLQVIRQKNLYIFLCLPNFFDLQKGVSIYRSSHLFVCYGEKFGMRGSFAAWDRDKKKILYINGLKYMNYHAVKPNFRGRFVKQKAINQEEYEQKKLDHLLNSQPEQERVDKKINQRDFFMYHLHKKYNVSLKELSELSGIPYRTIADAIKRTKERFGDDSPN